MTEQELITLLRQSVAQAGSINQWCVGAGVHPPYVSDVLRDRRPPSPKIAAKLGYRRVISYEPIDG
jgi:hypothetical protein